MGTDDRSPARRGEAPDEGCRRQGQDRPPYDPPPPGFADLGNGQLLSLRLATAADCHAAANWLQRHYPERSQDPPRGQIGPIYNMGHELTREARAGMPRGWSMGQRALVLVLADICNDRTRQPPERMDVSPRLLEELDITPGALRNILTRLAAAGFEFRAAVGKDKRGMPVFAHKGHAVDYQFPAIPPRTPKGPSVDGPKALEGASVDAPLKPEPDAEGASVSAPSAPKAHPSMRKGASVSAPLTTVTPKSKEDAPAAAPQLAQDQGQDQSRVGDGVDDKAQPVDAGTGPQSNPLANSQNRRVHQGPETVAGDDQEIPFHDAGSATDGSWRAHASDPDSLSNGHRDHDESPQAKAGGAGAPLSEPATPAGSDATRAPVVGYRWRSPQEIAAEQAAESRAVRQAEAAS